MENSKIAQYITQIHINGLQGRVLELPAPKKKSKQILLLYGHHASLERVGGIAEVLNRYGSVTTVDLPGFGGMDSFYKIGKTPTIDNFADYLAAYIKLKFKRRNITIIAMSFSLPIITRTFQKYPDLAKKVDLLVSFAGFVHKDDFKFSKKSYYGLRTLAWVFKWRSTSTLLRYLALNKFVIKNTYRSVSNSHSKMKDASPEELKQRIDYEIKLWQMNDLRTRMITITEMLTLDLCSKKVNLPIWHVETKNDRYFDNDIVEQHLRVIFQDVVRIPIKLAGHMPTVIVSAREASGLIPEKLRKKLRQ